MVRVGQMRVPCCQGLPQRAERIPGVYLLPASKALHALRHCGSWESGSSCGGPFAGHSSCTGSGRSLRESDRLRVGRWLCTLGKMVQQNVNQQVPAACARGVKTYAAATTSKHTKQETRALLLECPHGALHDCIAAAADTVFRRFADYATSSE